MGDKVSAEEREAISAYVARGGIVHHCMDGEAAGAHMGWGSGDFEVWLSRQNIDVVPMRELLFNSRVQSAMVGKRVGVDAIFKYAARRGMAESDLRFGRARA